MFICNKCAKKALSKKAKDYPFPLSFGRCEMCGKTGECRDVYSGADWAWKFKKGK